MPQLLEAKAASGSPRPDDLQRLLRRFDGRMKYVAQDLGRRWGKYAESEKWRALRHWSRQFDDLVANAHGNAYASGFRATSGQEPDAGHIAEVARARFDLESFYSEGFHNDLLARDKRYFDDDGEPNAKAIHERMRMYLGRCAGTSNGGWVDGLDEEEWIKWILGPNESGHCGDCQTFADGSPYRKGSIPTVPKGNDTPCLFNCDCRLQRSSDGALTPKPVTFERYEDLEPIQPEPVLSTDPDSEATLFETEDGETEYRIPKPKDPLDFELPSPDQEFRSSETAPAAESLEGLDDDTKALYDGDITAYLGDDTEIGTEEYLETVRHVFGRDVSLIEIARLMGSPAGSSVRIDGDGRNISIRAIERNIGLRMSRQISRERTGIVVQNLSIYVEQKRRNWGARIVATEIKRLTEIGAKSIFANAAGEDGSDYNGYEKWPRMGFSMEFHEHHLERLIRAGFLGVSDTHQLFTEYSEDELDPQVWWIENGSDGDVVFDLAPGSRHHWFLARYLAKRGIRI